MKRPIIFLNAMFLMFALPLFVSGQQKTHWPIIFQKDGTRTAIFYPQAESFNTDILTAHADVSVRSPEDPEPVFGTIWFTGIISPGADKSSVFMETIDITDVRIPDLTDTIRIIKLKKFLENEISASGVVFSRDSLVSGITLFNQESTGKNGLQTTPPRIIYTETPTILVVVDGESRLETMENSSLKRVVNTPYVLVYNENQGEYYLNAGPYWYSSREIAGRWVNSVKLPSTVADLDRKIKEEAAKSKKGSDAVDFPSAPEVIVSTTPAELIQTDGKADLQPVEGTTLWYVANTKDNIFKDPKGGFYYILLAGRWYAGNSLDGPWNFVPSDQLPVEFSAIPEGWEKDNVLSSVAGTKESRDAVRNAEVPQTARVDRKMSRATVEYEGDPDFQPIEGVRNTYYASNTSSSVLRIGDVYYCVDNGIWYVANGPYGPWEVATDRPGEVEQIPAGCPVYNIRFVNIYDVTPDFVYVGYTPGYTGCYVYGSTVVYGTGYYYSPWYGNVYVPRPLTWGFSMTYDPWSGWGFGSSSYWYGYYQGYYDGLNQNRHHHNEGWWGPPRYHPPAYHHPRGEVHEGQPNGHGNNPNSRSQVRPGTIYNGRKDVVNIGKNSQYTNPLNNRVKPGTQPSVNPGSNDNTRVSPSGKPINNQGGIKNGKVQPTVKPGGNNNNGISPSGKPLNNPGGVHNEKVRPNPGPSGKPANQPPVQSRVQPQPRPNPAPSGKPGIQPSVQPQPRPNPAPSGKPGIQPSVQPQPRPNPGPSGKPANQPSAQPQPRPNPGPSGKPGNQPASKPPGKTPQENKNAPKK